MTLHLFKFEDILMREFEENFTISLLIFVCVMETKISPTICTNEKEWELILHKSREG